MAENAVGICVTDEVGFATAHKRHRITAEERDLVRAGEYQLADMKGTHDLSTADIADGGVLPLLDWTGRSGQSKV